MIESWMWFFNNWEWIAFGIGIATVAVFTNFLLTYHDTSKEVLERGKHIISAGYLEFLINRISIYQMSSGSNPHLNDDLLLLFDASRKYVTGEETYKKCLFCIRRIQISCTILGIYIAFIPFAATSLPEVIFIIFIIILINYLLYCIYSLIIYGLTNHNLNKRLEEIINLQFRVVS